MSDLISRQAAIRFIRDKVSLSLFMKRSVDKADKACMELCDMLDRELPSAQPEPHWIPMSEREPEPGNYLTTFRKRGDPEDKRDVTIDLYWSGGWDDDGIDGDGTVFETLAWMPLPKPWKGEQNDKNENS